MLRMLLICVSLLFPLLDQFLRALVLFLREGLSAAELAITPTSESGGGDLRDEFKWVVEGSIDR